MVARATNTSGELNISAEGKTWREARRAEMAAMEAMPPDLRRAVAENNTNLTAARVRDFWLSVAWQTNDPVYAERETIKKLRSLEAGDIDVTAGKYMGAYRVEYPHKAAGATVLRYSSAHQSPRRRGRRALAWGIAS